MTAFASLLSAEAMKLRRTLALLTVILAPAIVVVFQAGLLMRNRDGWEWDADVWLSLYGSMLSIWAVFMLPLAAALMTALLYGLEHRSNGWTRLGLLPVPRAAVLGAKQAAALVLLLASHVFLFLLGVPGLALAGFFHPKVDMPTAVPLGEMAWRTALVFLASLFLVAIQCAVAQRSPGIVLPLGVGIAGTFFALFASGWKLGYLYPWLAPLRALHFDGPHAGTALLVGSVGGLAAFALALWDGVRRPPGS